MSHVLDAWEQKRQLQLDQAETTQLSKLAQAPRVLPLTFGPGGVWLQPVPLAAWAYQALHEIRTQR